MNVSTKCTLAANKGENTITIVIAYISAQPIAAVASEQSFSLLFLNISGANEFSSLQVAKVSERFVFPFPLKAWKPKLWHVAVVCLCHGAALGTKRGRDAQLLAEPGDGGVSLGHISLKRLKRASHGGQIDSFLLFEGVHVAGDV